MSGEAPLLVVDNLRVTFRNRRGGRFQAVRGVSLTVNPGEIVALVGESGSGKTTTVNAIVGLLPPEAQIESGSVTFAGKSMFDQPTRLRRMILGHQIGLVAQDPTVSLDPVKRVGSQVAEVFEIHKLANPAAARERAVELLRLTGLPNPAVTARQYPHQLSGGMQQRVLIAIAIASNPQMLVADEPTSALDVTIQRQILDQIEALTRGSGTAVIFITHDLAVAADRADRILVMSDGCLVEQGSARTLLSNPTHPYTRKLIASDPSLAAHRRRSSGPPPVRNPQSAPSAPLAIIERATKEYTLPRGGVDRKLRAVDDVTLTILRGETLALVGESGSGKSTLARLLLGLTKPTAGRISFDGLDLARIRKGQLRQLRRRMQVVYQNPYSSLDPRYTVARIIEEPLRVHRVDGRAGRRRKAVELVEQVALPFSVLTRKPGELSGGQCQRVAIARALALEPDLLVCDEPVSALDVTVQDQILRLLTDLQHNLGVTMLFISHDLAVVRQVADRIAVMSAGTIVELRDADDLFISPSHAYTTQLLEAIPGRRHTDLVLPANGAIMREA
jgi:peptide/nickel transport system ATP-binding protein